MPALSRFVRMGVRVLAAAMPLAATARAQAGDVYVDGDRAAVSASGVPSVGGTGSAQDPFWTLGQAAKVAKDGDVVHVAGICREAVAFHGLTDLTVRQWIGRTQSQIRGDVPVLPTAWLASGGSVYSVQLSDGLEMSGVVFNWDTTSALGGIAHAGHLVPAPSVPACQSTPNSWHWDETGDRLHVNLAGDDPRVAGVVAWCRKGTGLGFFECTRPLAEGLYVKLWPDPSPGAYGILFGTTSGARARYCRAWDCGYHSIGAAGQFCIDARIEYCEFRGQRSGTHTVLFGAFGGVSGRVNHCVFHLYALLGRDGTPFLPDQGVSAFYTHTEGFNGVITDVECRRCIAFGYPGHGTSGGAFWYGTRTAAVSAADEDDWRKYPVRFVDCGVVSSDRMHLLDHWGVNIKNGAFVRCWLDLTGDFAGDPIFLLSAGAEHRLLFDHCVVFTDTTGRALGEVLQLSPGCKVIAHNSTFFNAATDASGYTDRGIARLEANAVLKARQSLFVMASPGPFIVQVGFNNRPPADYDIKHCWYHGFSNDWFIRDHQTVRLKTDYRAVVDGPTAGSTAIYDVNPQFIAAAAPSWNFAGAPGGPLRTLKLWFAPPFIKYGVNGRLYDGRWGAYQYGLVPIPPLR